MNDEEARLQHIKDAKKHLSSQIEIAEIEIDDAWLRDSGPTFVVEGGRLAAVDWIFNGWGAQSWAKYDKDALVAREIAELLGVERLASNLVNEGGGIHVDGQGRVLLTETVQLGKERNPGLSKEEVEAEIHEKLGTHEAIWLKRGLTRDYDEFGTKGHVDIVACFVPDGRVLLHRQTEEQHPDFVLWEELSQQFEAAGLKTLAIEAPLTLKDHRDWVDYSYINHYVCNGGVICPSFDDQRDEAAQEKLSDAYPGRDARMVDARALFAMGGGIHCITQQQPSHWSNPSQTP